MKIKTSIVDFVPVGIDTKDDLEKFRQIVESKLA
jgi:CMP-2-keto-3-deoxyoctulosonic acid synthetase